VIGKDLIWLRSNPMRLAGATLQAVLFNGLAIAAVRLMPGLHTLQLPGVALLAVGTLLTVILLEGLLEAERAALGHWATLPRSISWVLSRKVLLAVALGLTGALPAPSYAASTVANLGSSAPALAYGAACVGLLGFFHAAFWMRGVDPAAPVSVLRGMLRLAQTLIVAGILHAGFRDPSRPVATAASFVLAVAFACALWHALPQRAALALDRSALRTPAVTASYALATLLALQFVRGFVLGVATSAGASLPRATTIAWLMSGSLVLGSSLLWLWMHGSPALSEQLGICAGKGRRAILREGLLWSLPAILFNQAYWAVAGAHVAESLQPASAPPATMTVLAASPIAALVVGVVVGPIVEELLFRGMLYRSLRTGWAVLPCWLLTTAVFLTDHTPAAAIPVVFGSVCITLAFERSRSLYASLLVHALYNGVLVLQLLSR
jgi:membrane protease YdiL (CAAX protease family)